MNLKNDIPLRNSFYGIHWPHRSIFNANSLTYAAITYIFEVRGRHPALIRSAKGSLLATCGLVSISIIALLSGLPGTNFQGNNIWVLLALAVIISGFIFVFLIRKKKPVPVSNEDDISLCKQRLLAEFADLDDDFENGRISEKDHNQLKAEKKAQLMALMRKQEEE